MERTHDTLLAIALPCELASLGALEEALSDLARPLARDDGHDLRLALWELVTNAVLHSGARAPQLIEVRIDDLGGRLRIAVSDPGPGFTPHLAAPEPTSTNGRGLIIVDGLSEAWGTSSKEGCEVWCELAKAAA